MKASELVEHLNKAIAEEGDLEMKIAQKADDPEGEDTELAGVVSIEADDGNYFLLANHETVDLIQ